jgi:hypothetical protein
VLLGDRTAQRVVGRERDALLPVAAVLPEEQACDGVRGERHRSNRPAHFDEHAAQLDETQASAVVRLGRAERQQARVAQGTPQHRVEPVAGCLDLGQPFRLRVVGQDRGGQGRGVLGLGGEGEVHGFAPQRFAAGRPSPT